MKKNILLEKRNCWSINEVSQMSVLIDGDNYYSAFFDAAEQAKKSIKIFGFEFESRLGLRHVNKKFPNSLRRYFTQLAEMKDGLEVSIRCWNATAFLSLEREKFPTLRWWAKTPDRVHFRHKTHAMVYGSHHEKFSLIDNCCAFLGGMDLSRKRWDTRDHHPRNPLRKDGEGQIYNPVHDLQLVCTGEIIGKLAKYHQEDDAPIREVDCVRGSDVIWPHTHPPQIENIRAAISRTDAAKKVFEIEQLYKDAIDNAEDFIFIENQYFSNHEIIRRICRRLRERQGPEVVVIGPMSYPGSFERAIYSNERRKAMAALRAADVHDKLLVLYPTLPITDDGKFIIVHSKLMIVDNEFLTLGSANLSLRSMKLDTELNISVEARGADPTRRFIRSILTELLAEHLDLGREEVEAELERSRSLVATVKRFQGKSPKTLREINEPQFTIADRLMILITPFVELKYAIPRTQVYCVLFLFFLMGMVFI